MRELDFLKPAKFQDYLTLSELSRRVDRSTKWIKKLEAAGRIPKAARHKQAGKMIRLWSPEEAAEIEKILSTHRPGRPKGS